MKRTAELGLFIDNFRSRHALQLDWVYVAKLMYAVFAMIQRGEFANGTTIVALVSGSDRIPQI